MKRTLEINYRELLCDENSSWLMTRTFDELIWNNIYELHFMNDDGSHGLPFRFADNEKATLSVMDNNSNGKMQKNRTIVQKLNCIDSSSHNLVTYIRTRSCSGRNHTWGEWGLLEGSATSAVPDGTITAQKLSSDIRSKLDNPLRPLYIAAGAEYNGTGEVIKKTAFWGEEVDHLPGHYYLNGLGDITEEEMMKIYDCKNLPMFLCTESWDTYNNTDVRTTLYVKNYLPNRNFLKTSAYASTFHYSGIEVLKIIKSSTWASMPVTHPQSLNNATKLKVIDGLNFSKVTTSQSITGLNSLVYFRFNKISASLSLPNSSKIDKFSLLYMIEKVNPAVKTAVVITVHKSVYAKCIEEGEWCDEVQTVLDTANGAITGGGSINIASA